MIEIKIETTEPTPDPEVTKTIETTIEPAWPTTTTTETTTVEPDKDDKEKDE